MKQMKHKVKHKRLYIFLVSSFITYFIYIYARTAAIAERDNLAFGGEIMLWFIPFIALLLYENIVLQRKESREAKQNPRNGNIHITEITDIKEV